MTNTKQKSRKSARQKRVLAAAILIAAIITVGASFAWFTSSDTVTNKLSASGSYGVAITEDFTPIDDWTPGQPVNKDVSTINTGNIDAYVKVTLSNAIDLVVYGTSEAYNSDHAANYITLSDEEVKSLQAGGRLVCAAGSAITDEAKQLEGTDYTPTTTGLYVFARKISTDQTTGKVTYEYVGYYYVAASDDKGGDGTYYQIDTVTHTTDSSESYSANVITTKTLNAQDLTFDSSITTDSSGSYINATYSRDEDTTADDIVIQIYLDGSYATNWEPVYNSAKNEWTFYYNYILESGKTSEQLVDKLVLSSKTAADAYVSFDYSLNVTADSVQVTYDENGNITYDAVTWDYTPKSTDFPKDPTDSNVYTFDLKWGDATTDATTDDTTDVTP